MFLFLNGIFLASQIWIYLALGETKNKVMQLQTFCAIYRNPVDFGNAMRKNLKHDWSIEDINNVEKHFVLDEFFHPVIYVFAITSGIFYLGKFKQNDVEGVRHDSYIHIFIFSFVALAGFCDCIENSFHKSIIGNVYNDDLIALIPDDALWNGCIFATTKWLIILTVFVVFLHNYFS